jgi:hypothetical protein
MRLPRLVYEGLPWLYFAGGIALVLASYRLHSGVWSMLLLLSGVLGLLGGVVVWLRRRDYRTARHEYWSRSEDPDSDDMLR